MANKPLYENLGSVGYDNLIYDNVPEADVVLVKIAASQGALKRGAVLVGTAGAELSLASELLTDADAIYILADDTDATAATTASAYRVGHFNKAALSTKSYTLVDADIELMRKSGILISEAV